MNKSVIIIIILMACSVFAGGNMVYVLNIKYDDGQLTLVDKTLQEGFYPDRKLQPPEGYKCEVLSNTGSVLYSFNFEVPLKEFTDVSNNETGELSGGLIIYDEQNFALVVPYFKDAKEIRFSTPEGKESIIVDVEEKTTRNRWLKLLLWLPILVLIFLIYAVWGIKKKKNL